jgi:hypothetical protein
MLDVNTEITTDWEWQMTDQTLQRQDSNFETRAFGQKEISGHKSQSGLDIS